MSKKNRARQGKNAPSPQLSPTPANPVTPGVTIASPGQADHQALDKAEAQVAAEWNVGDVILDTYEVTGILGEGGMGKVYKVHHRGWNTDLAVKSPRAEELEKASGAANFVRECETWVNLGLHPHIVSCYYVRMLGGIPRVFAEYVAGSSLKEWIDTRKLYEDGREKALARMLDVAIQFAWGLHYAHEQGLVHQDVKPANVMLAPDGTAKVTDFGLARARGMSGGAAVPAGQSILVSVGGMTPAYCSPEQAARQPLTRKTDIWSWSVSILEMFTGEVTWLAGQAAAESLADYLVHGPQDGSIPSMPAALAELLRRCFRQQPDDRPASMTEIAAQLQQIYAQATGQAHARPTPQASTLQGDSLNNKALSLYDLRRIKEAKALWQASLQANPGHLDTTYNLGLVLWRAAQKDDAGLLRDLQAAAVSSYRWRMDWLIAQVHLERGDVAHARAILEALPPEAAARPEVAALRTQVADLEHSGHRLCRTFAGHSVGATSVCLSEDGCLALSGSGGAFADKTLKLWDVATGQCLRTFEGHTDGVQSVCLRGDGRYALSGSEDKTLKLWDVATGQCLRTFEGHTDGVKSVCLSGDGRCALSGSGDWTLKLWEVATGQCLRTFEGHTSTVMSVCLSGDGRYALSGGGDLGERGNTLKLWDVAMEYTYHAPFAVSGIVTSETAAAVEDLLIEARAARQHGDTVGEAGVLRRARSVPGYENNAEIREAWSRLYRQMRRTYLRAGWLARTFSGHTARVACVCLSGDGRYALSGSRDNTLKLWEVTTGKCLRTFEGHTDGVESVCLSADGRHALSGSGDHTLKLWEVATGKCLRTFEEHTYLVNSVCLSGDGHHALSGSGVDFVRVSSAPPRLHPAAFSPALAESGVDHIVSRTPPHTTLGGTLKLWEVATGQCLRTFEGHTSTVMSVCLSGDGRCALSGSEGYGHRHPTPLKLWDVATGLCVRTFEEDAKDVLSVCLSGDGRYALSGSRDNTLKLWEVTTGKCLRTFEGHTSTVMSVCLSADERYALSGSRDNTLKLWEVATGKCLRTFEGHTNHVSSVCLSADGRYALSGSGDHTLKLWELDWELIDTQPADWDEGARPYLQNFLTLHTPHASELPQGREPTEEAITLALTRSGRPSWKDDDFKEFLYTLGCAGYGWLRTEGVRKELEKMVRDWQG